MKKTEKTNVMRLLEQKKIAYDSYDYTESGVVSGKEVAEALGQNPERVYKMRFSEFEVWFRVDEDVLLVERIIIL